MLVVVALGLTGLAVVLAAEALSHRSGLPTSVLLVLAGLAYGYLPGPDLQLDPEVVLVVAIPPLLYAAALESSLLALRRDVRAVVGLSVFLVLATALGVGAGLSWALPAVPLAAGVALGAAVAPPDPVAALSIGRRAGLPPRLVTLVEGEGLLNDATALTVLGVAVGAVGGHFSLGHALLEFVVTAAGGVVVGAAVARVLGRVRAVNDEPLVDNALSLGTPFAAYLAGEELHVSGVLAVVVAGLLLGHRSPQLQTSGARLQTRAVWRLVEFLLEGWVFLLIGQQLPAVLSGLHRYDRSDLAVAAAVTLGVVLLLRPLWLLASAHLPARLHARLGGDPDEAAALSRREVLALSWAGTRGVITLAAAFSLPEGFPQRDLLLFCAYLVVLVTLVGQGLTFGPLLRRLRLGDTRLAAALLRNEARSAATSAALARLDALLAREPELAPAAGPLRRATQARQERYERRVDALAAAEGGLPHDEAYAAGVRLRREMIDAERQELLDWRDSGRLPDADLRVLQRELDLEESVLPPPA
ncbi:sodium/proton antiporter (CPA1 family) [Motilibacter rhizosphaerae]|uniref:Sodium/proton antiporter (CPA1 family) n=1 Tax=Motilibacter rhizosphaerae TaxID=598652 RepID=A0A4Q7NBP2_9ACTN|nr:sodium/proton antiporter (CPA1 family) [Motilibacter rhizosphaerae]